MKVWLRIGFTLGILAVLLISSIRPSQAAVFDEDGVVEAGETIDDDLFLSADAVRMDGMINGNLIATGETVTIHGTINGDALLGANTIIIAPGAKIDGNLFAGAQTIQVQGEITGSLFSGAASLTLGSGALVSGNMYYGGYSLDTEAESIVNRDLFAGGYQAALNGSVKRDAYFSGGALDVGGTIGRDLKVDVGDPGDGYPAFTTFNRNANLPDARQSGLRIAESASIGNQLIYTSRSQQASSIQASPSGGIVYQTPEPATSTTTTPGRDAVVVRTPALSWLFDFIRQVATLLVFGALALWLAPALLNRITDQARMKPLPAAGYGTLTILAGYLGVFLAVGLIIALGLLFGILTLGGLVIPIFGVGFSGLALFTAIFTLLIGTGSQLIVAFMIGLLLMERVAPQVSNRPVWALLLGVLLLALVVEVPFVGWLISIAATLIGVGAMWLAYRAWRKPINLAQAVSVPSL